MIRLFTALCKSMLENLSEGTIFLNATERYNYHGKACPNCSATGKLVPYGSYLRYLVHRKNGNNIDSRVAPRRFKCKSCNVTHSLLPDVAVPYSPYSISLMLKALIAYFERNTTVVNICEGFNIAVSTLYEWKKRIASQKDLMLGMLLSRKTPALAFLRGLIESDCLSCTLHMFFRKYGSSFMQNRSVTASRNRPP